MATLVNTGSINFTAASWAAIDTTSFLNSETNTTATTTAFVSSSAFTPGAITIDGIGIKISTRSGAPTGTFSVRLHDGTAAVTGTTVTVNVTDISAVNGSMNVGWMFMKFSAPVLLVVATNYTVQVQSSTNAQVTVYRNATAANWSRFLRTTTTQAPAAADDLFVCGEFVSAGSNSTFTVTMDNTTSATTFGLIEIATKGILDWGVAASTNYYLKMAGNLSIYTDGMYHQGTGTTPVPASSTAKLEIVCSANVQFGVECRIGGTLKSGGAVITNKAFLAADASAAATSLTTDVSTGWLSGDVIALASTTRTKAESESKALTADASGTTLTITALTNAHSGTAPIAAEVANLTRNVQIFSASTTNQTYINMVSTAVVDLQSTEFYNMGSATALKRGLDVGITTGSCTINNCSVHDFNVASSLGINVNSGTGNNVTISNNTIYNIASIGLNVVGTTGTGNTYSNILIILTGGTCANFADLGGTLSNITGISATGAGITFAEIGTANFGSMSGFIAHSNTTAGISFANYTGFGNNPISTVSNITAWRNTTSGVTVNNVFDVIIDTVTAFGNATANVQLTGSTGNVFFKTITSNAGTTLTCPVGFGISADVKDIWIDSSTFGVTTTHATGDISITASNIYPKVVFRNCLFNSTTTLANINNMIEGSFVASARHNQTSGSHRTYRKFGTVTSDTTIFNKASPSERLTPSSATQKLFSGLKKFAVPSGQTAVINVFVRKSVAGDGAAYNGNQLNLVLKADAAAGVLSDTILATSTNAANGAFEKLTGTTPAITDNAVFTVYLDGDGTAGFANIDDFSIVS